MRILTSLSTNINFFFKSQTHSLCFFCDLYINFFINKHAPLTKHDNWKKHQH